MSMGISDSVWLATSAETDFDPLAADIEVDVAIVGGGITGLTTAMELVEKEWSVAVLEAERIVTGTTGRTTAKLTSQHGVCYENLLSTFGREKAQQYADANEAAIIAIEQRITDLCIDADFERLPAYVYATSKQDERMLVDEAKAAQQLGLPAAFIRHPDLPLPNTGALRFDNQAQLHPRKYLLAVASAIDTQGGHIFEQTRAIDLEVGSPCRIVTSQGHIIRAENVVVASMFPFVDRAAYFARMHLSRSYLLAVEIVEEPPRGMYLSADSSPWTFRPLRESKRNLLIIGGQSHIPAQNGPPTSERYRRCEAFAREHFSVQSIEYRWSAHDFVPVDGVPFIGGLGPIADNVYVGTGFKKWGMTGGTVAGILIAGLIVDGTHPWADVFDPTRFVASSVPTMIKENASVAKRLMTDQITFRTRSAHTTELPQRGDGKVVTRRGRPIAVHRDEEGTLSVVSAICPHMWCIVDWNDHDQTWDCPCHGSRFGTDGKVLCGPAVTDLSSREL